MAMAGCSIISQEISNLVLPDRGLLHGVHASFSARNSFLVYGTHRASKATLATTQYLHEITPRPTLFDDYVRKLVCETHNIFMNSKIDECSEEVRRIEIVRISQQYRSVILACVEEIHTMIKQSDNEDDDELLELLQKFSDIELLWHLLHILIFDAPSATRVLYKLLDWLKWHFVDPQRKRADLIQTDEPSEHPEYWDTIFQLLLQGNINHARSLLSMHSRFTREEFVSLDELLKKMPFYVASCGVSLNEFHVKWKLWQDECKTRLERGEYSVEENLENICRLLIGDLEMLSAKSYLCETWYHLMISVLLYTNPCINISKLGDMARTYYNNVTYESKDKSNLVDSTILAAMELDIRNIVNLICSFNDGWWFATHFMDLLCHSDFVENSSTKRELKNYRKFFLKNYAETLMSHSSLWQVGIDYLDECKANCEVYLERIPLKTEVQARKIIYLAKKRNLDNLVKSVANVMAARAIAHGNLSTALMWVMESKDIRYADEIADRWLNDYTTKRTLEGLEIFRNMGSCMLISDKLAFVGKYCEFHKLYSDKNLKAAASLLISLVTSELAPPSFQMIMLLDALPLLEAPKLIFTKQDTCKLMECLEETLKCTKDKSIAYSSDQENIIRLALTRNLARCFIILTEDSDLEDN